MSVQTPEPEPVQLSAQAPELIYKVLVQLFPSKYSKRHLFTNTKQYLMF